MGEVHRLQIVWCVDRMLGRRRLLMLEHVTCINHGRRIDGNVSFVDMPDDAFFVDQEGGTIAEALLLVEHAVILNDRAFEIAEQRKCNPNLLCKFAVGGNTVYAHAEDLSVG